MRGPPPSRPSGPCYRPCMSGQEVIGIIGTVLGVGIALAVLILRVTSRLDADRRAADARADADRRTAAARADADRRAADADRIAADARADADRRALQQSMDTFRNEMLRLAERQARLEGAADD